MRRLHVCSLGWHIYWTYPPGNMGPPIRNADGSCLYCGHIPERVRLAALECNCSVHDIHPDDVGAAHARDCPRYD